MTIIGSRASQGLAVVVAVAVLFGGRVAGAQTQAIDRSCELTCVGPELVCLQLRSAVAVLLHDDPRFVWGPAPEAVCGLRIDATAAGFVRIQTSPQGRPAGVRTIETPELDLVATEIVAQVVRSMALALVDAAPAPPPVVPAPPPAAPSPVRVALPPPAPSLTVASAPETAAPAPERPLFSFAAGYLLRSVIDTSTAGGVPQPLAQGVAVRGMLLPATRWSWLRPLVAVSLEYNRFALDSISAQAPGFRQTLTSKAGLLIAGLAVRPLRFVEVGAGAGIGLAYNQAGGDTTTPPLARGQVSLTAVGLPLGLEVGATLTLDYLFSEPYVITYLLIFPGPDYARFQRTQPGGLFTVGFRI
jgi:hypothetical protein